jgi:hypothetical protein
MNESPAAYPAPPRLHWGLLLLAFTIAGTVLEDLWRTPYSELVQTALGFVWIFYFCTWLRKLDSHAKSLPLAWTSFLLFLASDALDFIPSPSRSVEWLGDALCVAGVAASIVLIFVTRSELMRHYNEREPIGLNLGKVMTYFFSYVYFQYHLNQIAQFRSVKQEERQQVPTVAFFLDATCASMLYFQQVMHLSLANSIIAIPAIRICGHNVRAGKRA